MLLFYDFLKSEIVSTNHLFIQWSYKGELTEQIYQRQMVKTGQEHMCFGLVFKVVLTVCVNCSTGH